MPAESESKRKQLFVEAEMEDIESGTDVSASSADEEAEAISEEEPAKPDATRQQEGSAEVS